MKNEIIDDIIAAIKATTEIKVAWKNALIHDDVDGKICLSLGSYDIVVPAVIKTNVLAAHLPDLKQLSEKHSGLLVLADRIMSWEQEQLKKLGIGFIDAAGNAFIRNDKIYILVEGKKHPTKKVTDTRAFSKGGIKVIFHLFLDEGLLNMPLRHIAMTADVSLDTAHKTIHALKRMQFLMDLDKDTMIWNNKRELLTRWITEYDLRLKPGLFMNRYDFLQDEGPNHWKQIKFKNELTCWGGEPAGDILTNNLKPLELTLYTPETDMQLTRHYRIVPEKTGSLIIYKRFWPQLANEKKYAPPLLVYADLVSTGERRNIEIAQRIFDEHLQDQFLSA